MRLTFHRSHHLNKIHAELLAVPSLAPVAGPDGRLVARCVVSGDGRILELTVPDDADEAAICAVVESHDPTPPLPPVSPDATLRAAIQRAGSLADVKAALLAWLNSRNA